MVKKEHPHREGVDDTSGDKVIVPAGYYNLRDYKRPNDRYDQMFFDRLRSGKLPERKK